MVRGMGMAKQQQLKATESDIQKAIREYLQWNGWFVIKIHQSLGSYKGIADLYALKNGRHVWIEVKTDRGRQSEYQEQFEQDIRDHGGRYIVARGIEDIEKYLKGEM
jgi:Holliday junction resolvase